MSGALGAIAEGGSAQASLARINGGSTQAHGERSFKDVLATAKEDREAAWQKRVEKERARHADPEAVERAQKGAEQLVAATFIVPILKQMRESNMAAEPFGPGMYEQRMGPMLDAQIADRIVSAQRLPIVDAIRDRMLGVKPSRVESGSGGDDKVSEKAYGARS